MQKTHIAHAFSYLAEKLDRPYLRFTTHWLDRFTPIQKDGLHGYF
jgi:hypothetical protein